MTLIIDTLNTKYIFKSERLGFRNWSTNDLIEFAKMNSDIDVMEHFPKTLNQKESSNLIDRLIDQYETNGYTYYATELLKTGEFIGFIGLAFQEYDTDYTPATDIGWRLKKSTWGKGYATEGAKKCINFGFKKLNLRKIIAICTEHNNASENVMKKIGMKRIGEFLHPELKEYPEYKKCICYEITKNAYRQ